MSKNVYSVSTLVGWHEITEKPRQLPDMDIEILVYDGYIDDVVKAYLSMDGDIPVWIDQVAGEPLKDPRWWAEVPFPVLT